jgi:hypothetical protein
VDETGVEEVRVVAEPVLHDLEGAIQFAGLPVQVGEGRERMGSRIPLAAFDEPIDLFGAVAGSHRLPFPEDGDGASRACGGEGMREHRGDFFLLSM